MAIYKPTYCYPYGGNVDFCVDPDTKAIYLQCKINTSNKRVTGYKIILVDEDGNELWNPNYISAVKRLNDIDYGEHANNHYDESFNGETLIIPFIQNFHSINQGNFSRNCLYTDIDLSVDYCLDLSDGIIEPQVNVNSEIRDWNNSFDQTNKIPIGTRILGFRLINSTPHWQVYIVKNLNDNYLQATNEITTNQQYNISVKYGNTFHDSVVHLNSSSMSTFTSLEKKTDWLKYITTDGSRGYLESITVYNNHQYSWKIILYQGDLKSDVYDYHPTQWYEGGSSISPYWWGSNSYIEYCLYSDEYNLSQYDMELTKGQILGSTGNRLQIFPTDVVLQKYWVQLGNVTVNSAGRVSDWNPSGVRSNISIYDSTYGHIYPTEGDFLENIFEQPNNNLNGCVVYKYSNDPDQALESDMVVAATPDNLSRSDIEDIVYHIFNGGLMNIDGVALQNGNLVLLKDLKGYQYLNGVYVVNSELTGWSRSGSYSEWSQFLGKVLLVKNGTQNQWQNFQSQAQAGGVIGTLTGSNINANHPIAGEAIYYINNNLGYKCYYNISDNEWDRSNSPSDLRSLILNYKGQYLFYTTNSTAGQGTISRIFIPNDALGTETLNDFKTVEISSTSILSIRNCTGPNVQTAFGLGFVQFTTEEQTMLWNCNNLTTEQKGSELVFIAEQPIVLYPNYENLRKNFSADMITYDAINIGDVGVKSRNNPRYIINKIQGTRPVTSHSAQLNNISYIPIDGIQLDLGKKFLGIYDYIDDDDHLYYWGYFEVTTLGTTTWSLKFTTFDATDSGNESDDQLPTNFKAHIKSGQIFNNVDILLYGSYGTPFVMYDLSRQIGTLNINSTKKTYIKPFSELKKDQYIVFTNIDTKERKIVDVDDINYAVELYPFYELNQTVINNGRYKLTGQSTESTAYWTWSSLEGLAPVFSAPFPLLNGTLYNDTRLTQETAYIYSFDTDPVYSSVTNVGERTPYKYKIVSYFKESDYNPVTYTSNGKIGFLPNDYNFSAASLMYYQYLQAPISKDFILDGTIYHLDIDQKINVTSAYIGAGVMLRGFYQQGAGKRWEYYRMAIFDNNDQLLQDTGNIYDGDFGQNFIGLSAVTNTNYYGLLIVEDEFNQIYTTGIQIAIAAKSGVTTVSSQLKYNYNLQSIDIELSNFDGGNYIIYRQEENTNRYEIVSYLNHTAGTVDKIRDYAIQNNRSYHYYIHAYQTTDGLKELTTTPILTNGKCWSIAELYPADLPSIMNNSLTIKKKYIVDENSVWLFKYNGDFGTQSQNFAKSEQATLGQYSRIGHGMRNNISSSVSALLGSEIISGKMNENSNIKRGYQERLRSARYDNAAIPSRTLTSSNEKIDMLNAWRLFAQSKNPKLLKDIKGQSWIVQIMSSQNTPMAYIKGQPETISFSWTQIDDVKDMCIIGEIERELGSDY